MRPLGSFSPPPKITFGVGVEEMFAPAPRHHATDSLWGLYLNQSRARSLMWDLLRWRP